MKRSVHTRKCRLLRGFGHIWHASRRAIFLDGLACEALAAGIGQTAAAPWNLRQLVLRVQSAQLLGVS